MLTLGSETVPSYLNVKVRNFADMSLKTSGFTFKTNVLIDLSVNTMA